MTWPGVLPASRLIGTASAMIAGTRIGLRFPVSTASIAAFVVSLSVV